MKKFIMISLLIVTGRAYDITTTWLYTPDLQHETNIIVKLFGIGWTGVILFQALIVALVICLLYYSIFRFTPVLPANKNLTKKEYISLQLFGDTRSFHKVFYAMPTHIAALTASTGYIAAHTLIRISFIVGGSTTLLLLSESYRVYYRFGIPYILFGVIIGLAVWFTVKFWNDLYKTYLKT